MGVCEGIVGVVASKVHMGEVWEGVKVPGLLFPLRMVWSTLPFGVRMPHV